MNYHKGGSVSHKGLQCIQPQLILVFWGKFVSTTFSHYLHSHAKFPEQKVLKMDFPVKACKVSLANHFGQCICPLDPKKLEKIVRVDQGDIGVIYFS